MHWYPKIPGVISASSFDGKIGIYNIEVRTAVIYQCLQTIIFSSIPFTSTLISKQTYLHIYYFNGINAVYEQLPSPILGAVSQIVLVMFKSRVLSTNSLRSLHMLFS